MAGTPSQVQNGGIPKSWPFFEGKIWENEDLQFLEYYPSLLPDTQVWRQLGERMVSMADIHEPTETGAQPKAMPDVSINSTHQDVACWIMFYHEQFHMANKGRCI